MLYFFPLTGEQTIAAAKTFDSCDVQTADDIFLTGLKSLLECLLEIISIINSDNLLV